jgi:hypothetical protein
MKELVDLVVRKHDGSLKAEHEAFVTLSERAGKPFVHSRISQDIASLLDAETKAK